MVVSHVPAQLNTCLGRPAQSETEDVVEVVTDSKLALGQLTGDYRVNAFNLALLHGDVKLVEQHFAEVIYKYQRRSYYWLKRADKLANLALERHGRREWARSQRRWVAR